MKGWWKILVPSPWIQDAAIIWEYFDPFFGYAPDNRWAFAPTVGYLAIKMKFNVQPGWGHGVLSRYKLVNESIFNMTSLLASTVYLGMLFMYWCLIF